MTWLWKLRQNPRYGKSRQEARSDVDLGIDGVQLRSSELQDLTFNFKIFNVSKFEGKESTNWCPFPSWDSLSVPRKERAERGWREIECKRELGNVELLAVKLGFQERFMSNPTRFYDHVILYPVFATLHLTSHLSLHPSLSRHPPFHLARLEIARTEYWPWRYRANPHSDLITLGISLATLIVHTFLDHFTSGQITVKG